MNYQAQAKQAAQQLVQHPGGCFQNLEILLGSVETELHRRFDTWNTFSLSSEDDLDNLPDEMARAACEIIDSLDLSVGPTPDA